jgi:hypothetical protein
MAELASLVKSIIQVLSMINNSMKFLLYFLIKTVHRFYHLPLNDSDKLVYHFFVDDNVELGRTCYNLGSQQMVDTWYDTHNVNHKTFHSKRLFGKDCRGIGHHS